MLISNIDPKEKRSLRTKDYRPISLISAPYKILAKALSNRIREVLHEATDGNQLTFVKDRNSIYCILIAYESVEDNQRIEGTFI